MNMRALAHASLSGVLAAGILSVGLAASGPAAAQPAKVAARVDASGRVMAPGEKMVVAPRAAAAAAASKVCLQLHNGSAIFNLNLTINPDVYPHTITGGTITGTICSGNWHATGGSIGSSLSLTGAINAPNPSCASTIGVKGTFASPADYNGTYGFNGSSAGFNHHTLMLGYDRPTCP